MELMPSREQMYVYFVLQGDINVCCMLDSSAMLKRNQTRVMSSNLITILTMRGNIRI